MLKFLDLQNIKKWDDFIHTHPDGSIFHHSSWINVISSTYNYEPVLVILENPKTGAIDGAIPFFLIDSSLTGKRLVSLPFTSYCKILMPDSKINESIDFVLHRYTDIDYLELKSHNNSHDALKNYVPSKKYCTHILDLKSDIESIFKSLHSTSIRQRIRRAKRDGLKFRVAQDERDLKRFYELETGVRKRKGLPPSPYRFFMNIWKNLKSYDYIFLPVVEYENKIIAAAIVLKFKNKYYLEYSASDSRYLKYSPNQLLIWETIVQAHKNGAHYFDFGRSSYSNQSLIEFKQRWATQIVPLTYHYYPRLVHPTDEGLARKFLEICNRKLPKFLLKLEGNIIYPHLG